MRRFTASAVVAVLALLCALATLPHAGAVEAPSFDRINPNYRVYFDGVAAPVVQNDCQASGDTCLLKGANNIASVTMQERHDAYIPIEVVVEKIGFDHAINGVGLSIRPSHLHEEGSVRSINTSALSRSGSVSFVVTDPCQLSVELGSEDVLFRSKSSYWSFTNLVLAINPPESSWPRAKPLLVSNGGVWRCFNTGHLVGRPCIVAQADRNCSMIEVPFNTDLYFSSSVSRSFLWGNGCGSSPKEIHLQQEANLILDEDVVIFARVVSSAFGTAVYGYGILSNYYMQGQKDAAVANNLVSLGKWSQVLGVILMDSTYNNIKVLRSSSVAWTKSFAWESETDGVTTGGIDCVIRNNFFKVNGDVLKPYQAHTVYQDNSIWHQTAGRAVMLSWGNWEDNMDDRDSTTQILRTFVIHDYLAFETVNWDPAHPEVLSRQSSLVTWGTLIGAQHSMNNYIGRSVSPVLIKYFYVEGAVGVVMSMSTGYWQLGGAAPLQDQFGCGGNLEIRIEDLDLRRVRSYAGNSLAGGCNEDYTYNGITNAACLCTSTLLCGGARCHVNLEFINLKESEVRGAPKLAETFHIGNNTVVHGLTTPILLI